MRDNGKRCFENHGGLLGLPLPVMPTYIHRMDGELYLILICPHWKPAFAEVMLAEKFHLAMWIKIQIVFWGLNLVESSPAFGTLSAHLTKRFFNYRVSLKRFLKFFKCFGVFKTFFQTILKEEPFKFVIMAFLGLDTFLMTHWKLY